MNNFENQIILRKRKIKNYGLPYVIAEIGSNYDQNLKKQFAISNYQKD